MAGRIDNKLNEHLRAVLTDFGYNLSEVLDEPLSPEGIMLGAEPKDGGEFRTWREPWKVGEYEAVKAAVQLDWAEYSASTGGKYVPEGALVPVALGTEFTRDDETVGHVVASYVLDGHVHAVVKF